MCREAAGFEPAAGVTGIVHYSESGVQSCQELFLFERGCRMYQALYRKWRPQTFDEVVGQEHITETLKNQVKSGHLSHAYIFIGTRGTGKTTCARILAKAVNCEHPVNGNPCGMCPACRGIAEGSVMDVVELDAASNNGVDNVRALREEAVFSPAAVKKRVYIIDEVHMLSTSAFNALLKILEEPPEHLMFILATTELQKVPATILSRCQRHSFRRIDAQKIAAYLEHIAQSEHFELSHDAAELIARLAEGGVRDALSLLDQCSAYDKIDVETVYSAMGLAGNRRISGMLDRIIRHDAPGAVTDFNALWMDGKDPATFLKELSSLMRDVLIEHVSPTNAMALVSGGYDAATLSNFAGRMTKEELICAMETVQRYSAQMREVKNPKTVVELCLISLCDNTLGESISELRARVSRLEANAGRAPEPLREQTFTATDRIPAQYEPVPAPRYDSSPVPRDYGRGTAPQDAIIPPQYETERDAMHVTDPAYDVYVPDYERAPLPDTEPEYVPMPEPIDEPPARSVPARTEAAERAAAPGCDAAPAQSDAEFWRAVCDRAAPKLAPDLRVTINSEDKVRGRLDGNILRLECIPGFLYGRLNKTEVLGTIGRAAGAVAGREVRVILSELKQDEAKRRSVDELKQFKEVRFI